MAAGHQQIEQPLEFEVEQRTPQVRLYPGGFTFFARGRMGHDY